MVRNSEQNVVESSNKPKDAGWPVGMVILAAIFTISIVFVALTTDRGNVFSKALVLFGSVVIGPIMAFFVYNYFQLVFWIFEELYNWSKGLFEGLGVPSSMVPVAAIALALFLIMVIPF